MNKLKHTLLTWTIVYVLITVLIYVLDPWLKEKPFYLQTLVLSFTMVTLMQYLIFPSIETFKKKLS